MSKQFNRDMMLATIGESLDGGSQTLEEIQMETTNTDPWIIGDYQASEALEKFDVRDMLYTSTNLTGVFGAIEYVTYYENDLYGSVDVDDLLNPEILASMVAYINMNCVLDELSSDLNIDWDDEFTSQQVDNIKNYISHEVE